MPGLTIGDTIPNIQADSTHGKISLYDYLGDSWGIIFSHPGTLSRSLSVLFNFLFFKLSLFPFMS